jgi:hypothetical protein
MSDGHSEVPKPVNAREMTPHNRALYEAGKTLLVESVETGREFCKTMITVASGAVAVFVALLGVVVPKDHIMTPAEGARGIATGVIFLLAALSFVVGYLPRPGSLSLDLPSSIESTRQSIIRWRLRWGWIGFILFVIGVTVGAFVALSMIGTHV